MEAEVGHARERYDALMADPAKLDALLLAGVAKPGRRRATRSIAN